MEAALSSRGESVRQAKDAGYSSGWFSNIFALDGMTACALAGREVPDITSAPSSCRPTPAPALHGAAGDTTQAASGGRFILGIGLSHQIVIEGILGLSSDEPARHMREYLEVLMPILDQDTVEHSGELYQVNNPRAPRAPRHDPPKAVVAALGPVMLKLSAASPTARAPG